jgi:hypothetical protein
MMSSGTCQLWRASPHLTISRWFAVSLAAAWPVVRMQGWQPPSAAWVRTDFSRAFRNFPVPSTGRLRCRPNAGSVRWGASNPTHHPSLCGLNRTSTRHSCASLLSLCSSSRCDIGREARASSSCAGVLCGISGRQWDGERSYSAVLRQLGAV